MKQFQFILSLLLICLAQVAQAADEMELGQFYFNKQDYKSALVHFTQALKQAPDNCNALYYEAVTLHKLGQMNYAKQAYATVIMRFPNTEAAKNAQIALNYLNPSYLNHFKQQVTSEAAANSAPPHYGSSPSAGRRGKYEPTDDLASLPDQARISYQRAGRNMLISAYINNHPIDMFFDSGAEATVITQSQLDSLGLRGLVGAPVGMSYGVGDGGGQKTWIVHTNVTVGQITRKNFPVAVQEDPPSGGMPHALLGETFFKDFVYKLEPVPDESHGLILFQKKGAKSALANNNDAIPFKSMGNEMIVSVEVNGRTIPMIYDTGADTCCFTMRQWTQMGMSIPDDAETGMNTGIAGVTRSHNFVIERMRLGNIIKQDVPVSVVESSNLPAPLLGNSFFGDLHVEVDNSAHLIRIRR